MKRIMAFAWTALFAAGIVSAQTAKQPEQLPSGIALGVKAGTLGLGADVTVMVTEHVNLRVNGNYLQYDHEEEIDDIDYDLELDFQSLIALLDWHPFVNGFRLSGGAIFNGNELTLNGTPSENETIGGRRYTPEEIGTLMGDLDFDQLAPYVGIGYGRAVGPDRRWSFVFDLGLIFQSFEVDLRADGLLASDPQFRADLEEEEDDIQEELDDFKVYPVLAFGVAYQF